MEIKVRDLGATESKSVQEVEQQLLDEHQQQLEGAQEPPVEVVDEPTPTPAQTEEAELDDDKVLSYLGKRYGRELKSFDDLASQRDEQEEMDEEVKTYLKYKKETGRGFEDFKELNKDYDSMNEDDLLRKFYLSTQDGLDDDDVNVLLDEFFYDEDYDDESVVKKTKLKKKKAVNEAKKFFNDQKEKYRVPLESSTSSSPKVDLEEYESYKQYMSEAKSLEEENMRKAEWFQQKTEELFNGDFKGFDFTVDDKKFTFMPTDREEIKKIQSNPYSFITKYLDDNGLMKDAAGYHRSLAMAMNPERFAKFFYEQGQADATDDLSRKIKNVNMSERRAPESIGNGEMKIRAVNPDSGSKLKIVSRKN
jgi:uncharacterized protein YukJ